MTTIQEHAYTFYEIGFSVIPLHSNPASERKRPALKEWTPYMQKRADWEQMRYWFENNNATNLGLVMGEISCALAVDVDGSACARFERKMAELPYGNLHTALINTFMQKTGSGGYHFVFRLDYQSDKPDRITALIRNIPNNTIWRDPENKHSEIRFKYNGGFIVGAPSIHPNDQKYIWNGKAPHLITADEIKQFIDIFGQVSKQMVLLGADSDDNKSAADVENYTPKLGMTPAYMKAMLDMIVPRYVQGQRQDIILYLSGGFYKAGFRREQAETFVTMLCRKTGDSELPERLAAVKNTYSKPVNQVKGFSGLEGIA